jgi:hypothetical protein
MFGIENLNIWMALGETMFYVTCFYNVYRLATYAFCRKQVVENLTIEAQGANVAISNDVDYPHDKVLSDIKRSTLLHNLFELCYEKEGRIKRIYYLLFYKGTRFVTNAHAIDFMNSQENKKLVVILRSFQKSTPDVELTIENFKNMITIPDSEVGTGYVDETCFPLRRDISSRFIPASYSLKSKFAASWFTYDGDVLRDVSREVRTLKYEIGVNPSVKTLAGADGCHRYEASNVTYRSPGGVFYKVNRVSGDCGYPLFIDDPNLRNSRIFAIHAAGSSINIDSYATFLNRFHIDYAEKSHNEYAKSGAMTLDIQMPEAQSLAAPYIVEASFPNKAKQVEKSRITPSPMYQSLGPTPFVISDLSQRTRDVAVRYSRKTSLAVDPELVKYASKSTIEALIKDTSGNVFKPKKLSFGEAIVAHQLEKLKSLNMNTSSGCPYIWEVKGIDGKKTLLGSWSMESIGSEIMLIRHEIYDYIYAEECYDENKIREKFSITAKYSDRYWDLSFLKYIKAVIDDVKAFVNGIYDDRFKPPIYVDYQKDELLKPGKATRIFSAAPLWYTILVRMYLGSFMDWCSVNCIHNEIAIGANPYGEEWDRIWRVLDAFKHKCTSDYKEYDTDANSKIMGGFFRELVSDVFSSYGESEQKVVFWLLMGVCFSKHVMDSFKLYSWVLGMPSGNPLTALINCWNQQVLLRMAFIILVGYPYLNRFRDLVKLITLGDDGARSVSSEIWLDGRRFHEVFSPDKVQDVMKHFGYTMTPGHKSGICCYIDDDQIEFLKRTFVYNKTLGRYVGPLNLKSMVKMLYYTKNGNLEICSTNYKKFMLELSYHGRQKYDLIMTRLCDIAREREVDFPIAIPYEDALLENSARQFDIDEVLL